MRIADISHHGPKLSSDFKQSLHGVFMGFHLFTNNCHAHWNAIGEIRSRHEILARDWSVQIMYIMYMASVTERQTDYNTSLPLAGEVITSDHKSL